MSYTKLYVWGIASVAALGGLLFGYDWVVSRSSSSGAIQHDARSAAAAARRDLFV